MDLARTVWKWWMCPTWPHCKDGLLCRPSDKEWPCICPCHWCALEHEFMLFRRAGEALAMLVVLMVAVSLVYYLLLEILYGGAT